MALTKIIPNRKTTFTLPSISGSVVIAVGDSILEKVDRVLCNKEG